MLGWVSCSIRSYFQKSTTTLPCCCLFRSLTKSNSLARKAVSIKHSVSDTWEKSSIKSGPQTARFRTSNCPAPNPKLPGAEPQTARFRTSNCPARTSNCPAAGMGVLDQNPPLRRRRTPDMIRPSNARRWDRCEGANLKLPDGCGSRAIEAWSASVWLAFSRRKIHHLLSVMPSAEPQTARCGGCPQRIG